MWVCVCRSLIEVACLCHNQALSAVVGVGKYGNPYYVAFDTQNLLGMGTTLMTLAITCVGVLRSRTRRLGRRCGMCAV